MNNTFDLIPGAAGFQLSNPSVADLTSVRASLDIFKQTSMKALRERSLLLTGYLESLLGQSSAREHFTIITPTSTEEHGAQLSVKLQPGLLHSVLADLEAARTDLKWPTSSVCYYCNTAARHRWDLVCKDVDIDLNISFAHARCDQHEFLEREMLFAHLSSFGCMG